MEQRLRQQALELLKENDIQQYYLDFETFMAWENPPLFKVELVLTDDYHAQVIEPQSPEDPFIIELSSAVPKIRINDYKATLFHEFTHIFDDCTIHKSVISAGILKPSTWYTEAHATEISLMFLCRFEKVDSIQKVSYDSAINYCGTVISLAEFGDIKRKEFEDHFADANEKLLDNDSQEAVRSYADAIKRLQYYLGFLRFVRNHCSIDASTYADLLDAGSFSRKLGIYITRIRKIVLKKDISIEEFAQLKEYDHNMFVYWRMHKP